MMCSSCMMGTTTPFPSNGDTLILEQEERKLWETSEYIERKINENTDPFQGQDDVDQYLRGIVLRLVPDFVDRQPDRIRIHILFTEIPNAFILPNGALYITTGMLTALENEAQLATIMGHEISHFIRRHAFQQHIKEASAMRQGILFGVLLMSPAASDLWTNLSVSGYSRDLERDADQHGIIRLLKAGYQPDAAIRAFEILRTISDNPDEAHYGVFASHPRLSERIVSCRQYLSQAEVKRSRSGNDLGEDRFVEAMLPVWIAEVKHRFHHRIAETGMDFAARYHRIRPKDPRALFLMGEILRHRSSSAGDKAMLDAIALYRKALTLNSSYADCYKELGLLYRSMHQSNDSKKAFNRYLELVPDAPDALIIRSFIQ